MSDATTLGVWVRRFLLEYLVGERNLAHNTQCSYRDTLVLLIPFVAAKLNKPLERLTVIDISADLARLFLTHVEESRKMFHRNPKPKIGCASRTSPLCG